MGRRFGRFSYAFPLGRDDRPSGNEPILWMAGIVASSVYRACSGERWMSDVGSTRCVRFTASPRLPTGG
jgi:hypothetical protein